MPSLDRMSFLLSTVALVAVFAIGGCKKEDEAPTVISLSGTIKEIEKTGSDTGRVTVTYFSEKHNQEMTGEGAVTSETEILINGAAGTLADLKKGDRVRGEVIVEKVGDKRRQRALKIVVDRAKPVGE